MLRGITSLYLAWISQAIPLAQESLWILHHFLHIFSGFPLHMQGPVIYQYQPIHKLLKRMCRAFLPLNLLRNSIFGNSGPGTDSIPVEPESNPAFAAIQANSVLVFQYLPQKDQCPKPHPQDQKVENRRLI